MPQIFQVLKCYKCLIFQVHFTKKSNKWECKMCGEKQSFKRHYGIGTAQECRGHVQRLNEMQGNKTESSIKVKDVDSDDDHLQACEETSQKTYANKIFKRQSKWAKFIEEEEDIPNADNETKCCEETEVLEVPKKRKPYKRPKETSDCNEYSKIEFLNKKICHQDDQLKHWNGNENISKWSAYMHENKNPVNANPKIRYNKLTELDSNQFTNKADIKKMEHNQEENSKDINIKRDIVRNIATVEDTGLENKTDQLVKINTKSSQFLESDDSKTETILESKTRTLFSLCDDNDLDSILDC